MKLGDVLKKEREKAGISSGQMAASLPFSPVAVASRRRYLEMRDFATEGTADILYVCRGCPTEGSLADSSAYAGAVGNW